MTRISLHVALKQIILLPVLCLLPGIAGFAWSGPYRQDFDYYWTTIREQFAYFDSRKTDWDKVKEKYATVADTVSSRIALIHLLEKANHELYNGHVFLNTHTPTSNNIIPSGSDMKVVWEQGSFRIAEVRAGMPAAGAGLKPGMVLIAYNDTPVMEALKPFLPVSVSRYDKEMYEYAANMLFAGTHDKPVRNITAVINGKSLRLKIPVVQHQDTSLLSAQLLQESIGYIRIHNSLGNSALIKAFDLALDSLPATKGLILDLRETPGGGNTTVARGIMGRFIGQEQPYQKHIYINEENETGIRRSTLELVSPRGKHYKAPVVVLVGYWTGSMGEGIAIGFDALKRARVAGTPMAGLLGEIFTFETPVAKIPFSFPCVQLQHVDGRPRETYKPVVRIADQDQAIPAAVRLLVGKF